MAQTEVETLSARSPNYETTQRHETSFHGIHTVKSELEQPNDDYTPNDADAKLEEIGKLTVAERRQRLKSAGLQIKRTAFNSTASVTSPAANSFEVSKPLPIKKGAGILSGEQEIFTINQKQVNSTNFLKYHMKKDPYDKEANELTLSSVHTSIREAFEIKSDDQEDLLLDAKNKNKKRP